jgi:hypothetical protein
MTPDNLSKLLEQLRQELAKAQAMDDKGRELLRALRADIETLLERSEAGTEDSLLERLQDSIDHFEVTHPGLTTALSNLLRTLSNAGI